MHHWGRNDVVVSSSRVYLIEHSRKKKYFGLRNQSTCPLCRKRKGRSVARDATYHDPVEVERSLQIACTPDEQSVGRDRKRRRKEARDQLLRHGFKWENRCRLNDHAKRILVHIPWIGARMFAGTARYERMHVYFIGFCGYLMELLVKCVCKTKFKQVTDSVLQCHQFRDAHTGITHPRLPHLLKMTHLTAERRVRAIFYWAHVLGLKAEVVKEATLRNSAQRAVAMLQIILISLRGHRAYTAAELDVIFKGVGTEFFRALEQISQFFENKRYNKKREKHARNPNRYAAPVLFKHTQRSVTHPHPTVTRALTLTTSHHFSVFISRCENESDTASTDEDNNWGGHGMFAYSRKGLPHALKHAPELVKTFGHHAGPCTHLGEVGHKVDIKEAAGLARTYADRNKTTDEMTKYVQWRELFVAVRTLNTANEDEQVQGATSDDADDDSDRETNPTTPKTNPPLKVLHLLKEDLHFCDV